MPELPDVEIFRQHAEKHALNKKIESVDYEDAQQVLKSSKQLISRSLNGNVFTQTLRNGKHILMKISNNKWLAMHFGMTGYLETSEKNKPKPKYTKLSVDFGNHRLNYISKRKLGALEITGSPAEYSKTHNLGKDALECSRDEFSRAFKNKRGGIKNALMDQSAVAGIGNIYSDEILFQEKIHPKQKIEKLTDKSFNSLFNTTKRVMKMAIKKDAQPSQLPASYLLPNREEGRDCPRCGGSIKKIRVNGRGCFICPSCQTQPGY
ncbi:MAG: Fpg/Nei family DNA glycosylase [Bacteroidota bacterium]